MNLPNQFLPEPIQPFQTPVHIVKENPHLLKGGYALRGHPVRKNSRPNSDGNRPTSTESRIYLLSILTVCSRYSHKSPPLSVISGESNESQISCSLGDGGIIPPAVANSTTAVVMLFLLLHRSVPDATRWLLFPPDDSLPVAAPTCVYQTWVSPASFAHTGNKIFLLCPFPVPTSCRNVRSTSVPTQLLP